MRDTFCRRLRFLSRPTATSRRPELAEYLRLNPGRGRLWPELIAYPPPGVFTGFAMGTREQMLDLQQALHAALPGKLHDPRAPQPAIPRIHVRAGPGGRDEVVGHPPSGPATGASAMTAICAVGDDVNDIPMIRAAGLGVAMGNALPEVKAAADRIAPSQQDDGLATVVEWLLEG